MGVVIIITAPIIVEFIIREGNRIIHKQIERRDGLTFMRMKRRSILEVAAR